MANIVDKIKEQKFDFWKLGFLAIVAGYFANVVLNYREWHFLNNVDLTIHEAGHFIFMFFGNNFLTIAGGTILQIFIPLAFTLHFFITGQRFSSALTMFWLGQSFLNVSVYAGDAAIRALPLLGGDSVGHDWGNMLGTLGLLPQTGLVAAIIHGVGVAIILAAIICGILASKKERKSFDF